MREPALEQREKDIDLAAFERVGAGSLLPPALAGQVAEEGGAHLPVGDGVIGDDLRDATEVAGTLLQEVGPLYLRLADLLVALREHAPDEEIEHLDDPVRELFGPDDQVGE